ncbi:hypothetical protein BDU57DRAFT_461368, partial [Ampelomyces quisqualis]
SDTDSEGEVSSNVRPVPTSAGLNRIAGNISRKRRRQLGGCGPSNRHKLPLEAEIHLTAQIREDITIALC